MGCGTLLLRQRCLQKLYIIAAVAQLVERVLGKDEVMGPNPISSWKAEAVPESLQADCILRL